MKTTVKTFVTLSLLLTGWMANPQLASAHGSDEAMKAFLEPYFKIQTALAKDDLAAAQQAAKTLPLDKPAQEIAASTSLDDARKAFQKMSKEAVDMAADDEGYHVFKCPMMGGYWLENSTKTLNPYLGTSMPGCGKMLSKEDGMKVTGETPKGGGMNMPGM